MLTTEGKVYVKRFLAMQVPAIAQCIAFGVGAKAEAVGDTELQFETGRVDVTLTSYDFATDRLIFKAILPEDLAGKIYEVALFSQTENPMAGNFASKVLASFDSDSEEWVKDSDGSAAVYTTSNSRVGADSLRVAPALNATDAFVLNDMIYDLSGNSGADVIKLAYNISGGSPGSVGVRFRTDASNYYSFTTTAPATGYRVDSFTKGSAVVTGNPSWESINGIEVRVTAGGVAVPNVDFDGIRIEDTDTVNPEYVMVSRELLATPFVKTDGKVQEIEYSLNVSV